MYSGRTLIGVTATKPRAPEGAFFAAELGYLGLGLETMKKTILAVVVMALPVCAAHADAWSDVLSAKFRMFDCLLEYQLRDGVYGENYEDFKQKLLRPVEERCGREYLAAWTKFYDSNKICSTAASSCALADVDVDVAEMLGCQAEGEGGPMVPIICRRARMKAP